MSMSIMDIFALQEALCSCAIEGNQWAIDLLKLRDKDVDAFYLELFKLQQKIENENAGELE